MKQIQGKTWVNAIQELYPIHYWYIIIMCNFLKKTIIIPIKYFVYWIKFGLIKKYHILDLRQPFVNKYNEDYYQYGFRDVSDRMLYAMFNLLNEYINDKKYYYTNNLFINSDINNNCNLFKLKLILDEANTINNWWLIQRKEQFFYLSRLINDWQYAKNTGALNCNYLFELINQQERYIDQKTQEMILRLMKIRKYLY
jgi:hypothetical protein